MRYLSMALDGRLCWATGQKQKPDTCLYSISLPCFNQLDVELTEVLISAANQNPCLNKPITARGKNGPSEAQGCCFLCRPPLNISGYWWQEKESCGFSSVFSSIPYLWSATTKNRKKIKMITVTQQILAHAAVSTCNINFCHWQKERHPNQLCWVHIAECNKGCFQQKLAMCFFLQNQCSFIFLPLSQSVSE